MTAAAVAAFALGGGAPGASAQPSDGVHIDPDSPTGKEYAIPLQEARRAGAGAGAGGGEQGGDRSAPASEELPPLFGAGVERAPPSKAEAGRGADGAQKPGSPGAGGSTRGRDPANLAAVRTGAVRGDGSDTWLFTLGGAALVLAAGGMAVAARRVGRRRHEG